MPNRLQAACEEEERQDNHDPEPPERCLVVMVFGFQVPLELRREVLLCDLTVPERPQPDAGVDQAERERVDLLVDVAELSEKRWGSIADIDPHRVIFADEVDPALPGLAVDLAPGPDITLLPEQGDDPFGDLAPLVKGHTIRRV